ncbi:MAG: succinyl-CoA synthetase subunit beta [Marinobacter sp.]|uniref:succinyl-CoA synthetase subunit beta n=1 Tax=Marinobacter sp. TaxID=50741 RepID=UPI00299F2534|nr:succinyl-CoA synthetase subunit beta [Marinobacter sp.]MDX1634250.1 succinyl-CoA synthetase subunit beta [Marinobacter sp.]
MVTAALVLMLPLFFIGGPDWSAGALHKALWNLGHPLFFGLLVMLVAPRQPLRGASLWVATTLAVLLAGLAIELLQGAAHRAADWRDLGRNLTGAWLALAWCYPPRPRRVRLGLRGATLAFLLVELLVVAEVAARQLRLAQQLPALYDFREAEPALYWSGAGLKPGNQAGAPAGRSLALDLDTGTYSGVTLNNLAGDWQGYRALRVEVYNPDPQPLTLTLRIHDLQHDRGQQAYRDRFNRRLVLAPGANRFVVPLAEIEQAPAGRMMDMARIRRLGLFASALPAPRRVYLLDLRLE